MTGPSIRLGTNPIGWSNDDLPELGGDIPLETCLAEAAQAGFSGIEMGNKFPRDAGQLRTVLDRHELALVSGWYSGSLRHGTVDVEWTEMANHLDLLEAMGCGILIYCDATDSVHSDRDKALITRPLMTEDAWRPLCDRLTDLADRTAKRGLRMAYHPHMGTLIQTEAEIDRLMEGCGDSVGLLLDTGHVTFAGGDPVALAKRHADRIVHFHAKDVRAPVLQSVLAHGGSFLDAVVDGIFTVPGDGCVDIQGTLAVLTDADYDGWLVVEAEQDPRKATPLDYARMGHDNLRRMATTAGFVDDQVAG